MKRHPDGFGFFIPDDPEAPDAYIPRHAMEGFMTYDRVLVEVQREKRGSRFRAEVVKVVSHGVRKVVGQFFPEAGGGGRLRDVGRGWGVDLFIAKELTSGAKAGDLVAAEILTYPDAGAFTGKITEILGDVGDPLTDIRRVLITQHIPHEWPPSVLKEARTYPEEVNPKDYQNRKDLRNLSFVTIDGATAKDFDDAIYVEMSGADYRLYVAIADVSHYVRLGSAIDQEAYQRGTSVYFPNYVEPMLPEILSNGLCSLNPRVPRLAMVAEILFDATGHLKKSTFYEAVIESKARLTYGEAQEIIDGETPEKAKHVREEVLRAADLAKILLARRMREGSLDFEVPEIELVIDAAGNPVDILRSERLFAHRMIEEMMLAANVAVATFLSQRKIPALYRVHEPPPPESLEVLEKFLRNFGSRVRMRDGKLQKVLTKALKEFAGTPQGQVLNILTLRSMAQAKYSHNNVGHFGLGFSHYTHFTSPIRRYPDLIVHRLLKSQLHIKGYRPMLEEDLATAGLMLSACEQRSVRAERQIQAIKKARFMQKFIGQEFDGMISSVTKFGVFVLLRQFELDGLVSVDSLSPSGDKLFFDEENLRLVAKRSGQSFAIGDPIRIRVAKADVDLGQVDFELARGGRPTMKGRDASGPQTAFDVDQKLREAFAKRGLKPPRVSPEEAPKKIGFGHGKKNFSKGGDRRGEGGRRSGGGRRSEDSPRGGSGGKIGFRGRKK